MEDLNAKDKNLTKSSLILIDRQQSEIERLKIERMRDYSLVRSLNYFQIENEKIRTLINENVRFDYVQIQNEIYRLYAQDKNLTGIILKLSWREGENFGFIKGKIGKRF